MRTLTDDDVRSALHWAALFDRLRGSFLRKETYRAPDRIMIEAPQGGSFLTMPCADEDGYFGVKQVAVLPNNPTRDLPTVQAWYTLFDSAGVPVLAAAATMLTRMRTAAVSALAARELAAPGSSTLLVVGTGALAPWMAEAHARQIPYRRVLVWGRDRSRAVATAAAIRVRLPGLEVDVAEELGEAVGTADVVSCATTATEPIVRGRWLTPGHHLDLVGAFTPTMMEADADAVLVCDVVVDDREAAAGEAGDLISACRRGWSFDRVRADLAELLDGGLVRGTRPTLFKSVGLALEDLAVARLLAEV